MKNLTIVRWVTIGVLTYFLEILSFILFSRFLFSIYAVNLFSVLFSNTFNYISHSKFTFRSQGNLIKYVSVVLLVWIINSTFVNLLFNFGLALAFSKILVTIVQSPLTYLLLKKIVYNKNIKNLF